MSMAQLIKPPAVLLAENLCEERKAHAETRRKLEEAHASNASLREKLERALIALEKIKSASYWGCERYCLSCGEANEIACHALEETK